MKKIILIFLLILHWPSAQADPPFPDAVTHTTSIITSDDPTTFQELIYIGEEKRKWKDDEPVN